MLSSGCFDPLAYRFNARMARRPTGIAMDVLSSIAVAFFTSGPTHPCKGKSEIRVAGLQVLA